MTDKKIIAVVGATGAQGGGLARAILDDPEGPFTVRALTRDPGSAAAAALAGRGAQLVRADLGDERSVRAAFDGAYGAFVVTNYWESRDVRVEKAQAATAARAAKAAGLRHVVWSTLEDTRPILAHLGSDLPSFEPGHRVAHFESKAEANGYFTALGVPATFLDTTFYYEPFLLGVFTHRDADGRVVLTLPMGDRPLTLVSSEDIGRTAHRILTAGVRYVGRTIGLAGTHATGAELAASFARVLGEPVDYRPVGFDEFRASPFPGAAENGNMFQYFAEAAENVVAHRDLARARELNPRLRSFDDWLGAHRERIAALL